jgi:3'-phosphoadenosine 5'-phosphosulfate sulfotransferase (PAPS reductase)/FAD synthetase
MMLKTYEELKSLEHPTEEEFILLDRLQKIESVVNSYGEDKFAVSFSGGKDSTVLSALIDLALPGNKIPRVYVNTGIELNMIRDFVFDLQKKDDRIEIIKPQVPIKPMLERDGYPFKSKKHAHHVERYNRIGMCPSIEHYLGESGDWGTKQRCPKRLKYQFTPEFSERLVVSDLCCVNMKEVPLNKWGEEHNKPIAIVGIMRDEGGRRENAVCLAFKDDKLEKFQPMSVVTKRWEEWFIKEFQIDICPIYLPPYNFERTGCKGCPFAPHLQKELDTLEKYFPNEKKQCELIWEPVYKEYRRLGYRLRKPQIVTFSEGGIRSCDVRQLVLSEFMQLA